MDPNISIKRERLSSTTYSCANCNSEPELGSSLHLFTSPLPPKDPQSSTTLGTGAGAVSDEEMPTIQEALSLLFGFKFRLNENSELVVISPSEEDDDEGEERLQILGLCTKCTEGLRGVYEAHVNFSIGLSSPDGFLCKKFEKSSQRLQTQDLGREEDDEDWDNNSQRSRRLASSLQRQFLLDKEVRVIVTRLEAGDGSGPLHSGISSYSTPMDSSQLSQQAREVLTKIKRNAAQRNNSLRGGGTSSGAGPGSNITAIENMFPEQVRAQFKATLRKIVTTLKENQNKPPQDLFSIPGKPFQFPGTN